MQTTHLEAFDELREGADSQLIVPAKLVDRPC